MSKRIDEFKKERERLNEVILSRGNRNIDRFFALDNAVYRKGTLPAKTKELMGLVGSLCLRCDDCIAYHLAQIKDAGVTDDEFDEAMSIGLIVGGSITIPHIRRAYQTWEELSE